MAGLRVWSSKGFFALKGFFFCVSFLMLVQIAKLSKWLFTLLALEWLNSSVSSLMINQNIRIEQTSSCIECIEMVYLQSDLLDAWVDILIKKMHFHTACIGTIFLLYEILMVDQIVRSSKWLLALIALKWFFSCASSLMLVELKKCYFALFKKMLFCIVCIQVFLLCESFDGQPIRQIE